MRQEGWYETREASCHVPNPLLGGEDATNIYQLGKSKPHEHNIYKNALNLKHTQMHKLLTYSGSKC